MLLATTRTAKKKKKEHKSIFESKNLLDSVHYILCSFDYRYLPK